MNIQNSSFAQPRTGETEEQIRFRADRLFTIGHDWYFSTREGIDRGPFESKADAQEAITIYIREMPL